MKKHFQKNKMQISEPTLKKNPEEIAWIALDKIIDYDIGMSLVQGKMIRDLKVNNNNEITLNFRPTSFDCPIALQLTNQIKEALEEERIFSKITIYLQDHAQKEYIEDLINR